ncbi:hypothetical protein EJ05DRAFT_394317 [Pseudovirgaria hyperparasitica]|uniref:Zn(2)-C6 fungal-type domain-containing protein n=1 Tax=Pseudovirgaria hyperparasitica TaxID=470096 RepID=A0A6A6W5W4_9PEZI|nr:uncharacterized protein EJ05DRAFT_394317 [Pseudovirgaria hyperparasitica]KAF2757559.1 hypothetical protein EJ05DRAFT_394317 [Pseudovirgaria hyperparasitica]
MARQGQITRTRPVKACIRCRTRKIKCDQAKPTCNNCTTVGAKCSLDPSIDTPAREPLVQRSNHQITPKASPGSTNGESPNSHVVSETGPDPADVPNGSRSVTEHPKKRRRFRASCDRCHHHKVRCDQKLPCSRCSKVGLDLRCSYNSKFADENIPTVDPAVAINEADLDTLWREKSRGDSHWRVLLQQINLSLGYRSDELVEEFKRRERSMTYEEPLLPGNYPLGGSYFTTQPTHNTILSWIPERSTADEYVQSYIASYEQTYRLLHKPTFFDEVKSFWIDPAKVDPEWVALYMMVLGMGYAALNRGTMPTGEWRFFCRRMFGGAQEMLFKTSFLAKPSLCSLQTMCLMIIAKETFAATCFQGDTCWPLVGMTTRLAMSAGFHRLLPESVISVLEQDMRRRIWTTIVYLEIQLACTTGMPMLLRIEDFDVLCPANIDDEDVSPASVSMQIRVNSEPTNASYQIIIYQAFPVLLKIMERLNHEFNGLMYEEVLHYDAELRKSLLALSVLKTGYLPCAASLQHEYLPTDLDVHAIQIDIFFRRVLLMLHRRFASQPAAEDIYPQSYWSSLENSLALLAHNQALCGEYSAAALPPGQLTWFSGLFWQDFLSAGLTAAIHLLRKDGATLSVPANLGDNLISTCPARNTIIDTLTTCVEIWRPMQSRSVCTARSFTLLERVAEALQSTREGCSQL